MTALPPQAETGAQAGLARRWLARWPSPPIAVQILALLLAGLVVAQTVTLVLTLVLPPAPAMQHSVADIAAGLRGRMPGDDGDRPLVRTVETEPPSLQSPGWVASEQASADLARMLGVDRQDVRLLFYAPPPFAGTESRREGHPLALLLTSYAEAQTPPPGGMPRGMLPSGAPPLGFMGVAGASGARPDGQRFPGGFASSGGPVSARPMRDAAARRPVRAGDMNPGMAASMAGAMGKGPGGPGFSPTPGRSARFIADPLFSAPFRSQVVGSSSQAALPGLAGATATTTTTAPLDPVADAAAREPSAPLTPQAVAHAAPNGEPVHVTAPTAAPVIASTAPVRTTPDPSAGGRPLAAPVAHTLFGLAPAPFIEGDFVAALRVGPDQWATLRPQPEAFPNTWQRRVMMWFALSLAVVAPLGWLFARRLAAPLAGFAAAAEQLGRDPASPVMVSDGPAEVGRAVRAFNAMQARLSRYITDRTAMIGAISHDLRTPLARIRFRLERASPALRREIGRDIDQMEAMITSVLAFMREDSEAGVRQRIDLRSLLECVVDAAEVTGADIALEQGDAAEVEVSILGLQRVFTNLVENAIKYGDSAEVRLYVEGDETVTEIRDHGPGLAANELEQVFTPFYRGVEARTSSKQGVGLGLSSARSIVRAHGGDIRLILPGKGLQGDGLLVQVRLPLAQPMEAYRPTLQAAE